MPRLDVMLAIAIQVERIRMYTSQLESHDKDDKNFRSLEEMTHEAGILAELFK